MAAIKSATPVRGPHSGQDSDDGMSDNEELDLSADGTLDKKFTATQLTLLHAAKGEYKEASPGMRAEIANRVAETFMTKIEETGRRLKRKEKRGLTRVCGEHASLSVALLIHVSPSSSGNGSRRGAGRGGRFPCGKSSGISGKCSTSRTRG